MSEQDTATIELPVDADGVPIRLGDKVWMLDQATCMRVTRLSLSGDSRLSQWFVNGPGDESATREYEAWPTNLSHKAPDTLKRIKYDTYDLVMAEFIEDPEGEVEKLFERIERLFDA